MLRVLARWWAKSGVSSCAVALATNALPNGKCFRDDKNGAIVVEGGRLAVLATNVCNINALNIYYKSTVLRCNWAREHHVHLRCYQHNPSSSSLLKYYVGSRVLSYGSHNLFIVNVFFRLYNQK